VAITQRVWIVGEEKAAAASDSIVLRTGFGANYDQADRLMAFGSGSIVSR
jgi:hypothetical protein